jgi:hypothetical protein
MSEEYFAALIGYVITGSPHIGMIFLFDIEVFPPFAVIIAAALIASIV